MLNSRDITRIINMKITSAFLLLILTIIPVGLSGNVAKCPTIISRSRWQARESSGQNYLVTPLLYVVIHHTVTESCQSLASCSEIVRNIQNYHMDELNWDDIGLSFLIGGDGNVYEGVGWNREGAHTYGYNKKSIGVAFIGSYQHKNATEAMIEAARKLIACGISKAMLRPNVKVIGASQVTSTLSPGRKLLKQIQEWPEWSATV